MMTHFHRASLNSMLWHLSHRFWWLVFPCCITIIVSHRVGFQEARCFLNLVSRRSASVGYGHVRGGHVWAVDSAGVMKAHARCINSSIWVSHAAGCLLDSWMVFRVISRKRNPLWRSGGGCPVRQATRGFALRDVQYDCEPTRACRFIWKVRSRRLG